MTEVAWRTETGSSVVPGSLSLVRERTLTSGLCGHGGPPRECLFRPLACSQAAGTGMVGSVLTANYDCIYLVSHRLLIRQGPWSGHPSVCRCSSFEVFLWFDRVMVMQFAQRSFSVSFSVIDWFCVGLC